LGAHSCRILTHVRGRVTTETGSRIEPLAAAQHAVSFDPENAVAHAILGIVLNCDGRPDEGAAELATAIRINPNPTPTREFSRGN